MIQSRQQRFVLLTGLYFSQGLPFGFFVQALPVLMREQKLSLASIGLTSLLALPWALKFLWSPLIDRYKSGPLGARRSWILPLQLLSAGLLFILAWIEPSVYIQWVLLAVFSINLLAATQDIATDALAVELLPQEERGLGNAIQVAAYRFGMIIGGGVLLMWLDILGWKNSFLLMSILLIISSWPIMNLQEKPSPTVYLHKSHWHNIRSHFQQPGSIWWALLLAIYKGFDALATPMVKPMLVDLGYTKSQIGAIVGLGGSLSGLLGALVGGFSIQYIGRRNALLGFGLLQVSAVAGYLIPAIGMHNHTILTVVVIADAFCGSLATTILFTLMMDRCRSGYEAIDYTTQACVVVIATLSAAALSGFSAENLGYAGHFGLSTGLSLIGLVGVMTIYTQISTREPADTNH